MRIEVENLSKRFNREWIFKGLSTTFTGGNCYALTGPNGSGKSTLLQILWGQMPQTAGSVTYHLSNSIVPVEEIYQHISIATPYMDLIDEFTLEEQLEFHFNLRKIRKGLSRENVIEKMYLGHARNKQITNFSSGMKQRLKLGLAFFTEASILFLDEPGTNLDNEAFDWYKNQLNDIGQDKLVFIASNQEAEYPANAIILNIKDYK
ncbi:MAG: ABC transporter ATP-binding protein [Cyclobacteriaceae bacterium]|nr:ABC transporter ATP-binding protein [Cyclobacteriaceae bacterium]